MKKKFIMLAVVMAAALPLMADTERVGNYTWTYNVSGDSAVICGRCTGYLSDGITPICTLAISPAPTGAVIIPSTLGGKTVTGIGQYSFYGCSGLTSVSMPSTIKTIGSESFRGCSALTAVAIPNGVTSISIQAFYQCTGLTSVTIPDSVTSIGSSAFANCNAALYDTTSIPGLKLVDGWAIGRTGQLTGNIDLTGVRGVTQMLFYGNSSPISVTLPSSMTTIGTQMFYNCGGLTSVTIPDSVTSIGYGAFYNCTNLTSVAIPDGVTSIGSSAFYNCTELTSVTIPDSVSSIGSSAFNNCNTSLYDTNSIPGVILVDGWAVGRTGQLSGNIELTGIRGAAPGVFSGNSSPISVTLPACMASIVNQFF